MKRHIFFYLTLVSVFYSGIISAQSADEIVQKHIAAKGGADAWKNLNTMYMKMSTSMAGMELPSEVWIQTPDKMRTEMTFQGKAIINIIDGKEGWTVNPLMGSTKPEKLPESTVTEITKQADIAGPLIDYASKGHSVVLLDDDDLDGTEVYKLKLTEKDGDITTFYIDKESLMVLKASSKKMINGQESENDAEFGDYRKVEGLMFAFSTTMGFSGQTMVTEIDEIKINQTVDPKIFNKPE